MEVEWLEETVGGNGYVDIFSYLHDMERRVEMEGRPEYKAEPMGVWSAGKFLYGKWLEGMVDWNMVAKERSVQEEPLKMVSSWVKCGYAEFLEDMVWRRVKS